jgi:hypothetical protein
MATRKSVNPSPESLARAQRQRIASEDGAKAIAEFDQKAIAIRKNMERLRALRLAKEAEKEAEDVKLQAAVPVAPRKRQKKR